MKNVRVHKSVSASDIKPRKTKHYKVTVKNNNSSGKNYSVVLGIIVGVIILTIAAIAML